MRKALFCSMLVACLALIATTSQAQPYRLLFETDADSANPNELINVNFSSYADLLAGNTSGQESLDLNVNSAYSVAELMNDGGTYRLLFETDADSANPNELINVNFNSYADLLAGNSSGQESLDLNVNSAYSVAAILMEAEPVPEPATLAVIGLGVAALGRRKSRKG